MTGSGPFKIVEFKPGVKTVYAKNTDYVPRKEPASGGGGKSSTSTRSNGTSCPTP